MYIAIDIGGTKIALAKIDKLDSPTILGKETISTPQSYEEGISKIFNHVQAMAKWQKIDGIGITVPGSVRQNKVELLTFRKYQQSLFMGIGAQYKKIGAEFRYEREGDMADEIYINSNANYLYFLIYYRF